MTRKKNKKSKRILRSESLEARRCLAASLGWDGPGQGSADLSYYIGDAPSSIDQAAFESAIETALDVWSDVVDVNFTETSQPGQRDSLDFRGSNIDGSGGTLAQAYLPDDVNPARIAGDVEFDNAENWEIGNELGRQAFDLVQVAVHEIGHALGIDHINHSGSVLAPFISPTQQFTQLSEHDVDEALELYAPATDGLGEGLVDTTPQEHDDDHAHDAVEPDATSNPVSDDESAVDDTELGSDLDTDEAPQEDTPETNRHWRPWRRMRRFLGFWQRFGGRIIASPANHNAILPSDVNGDGAITPFDALLTINYQKSPNDDVADAVDTTGDGEVTPMDTLGIINDLSSQDNDQPVRPGVVDTFDANGEAPDLTEIGVEDTLEDLEEMVDGETEEDPDPITPDNETTVIGEEQPIDEQTDTEGEQSESETTDDETTMEDTPVEEMPEDDAPVDDEADTPVEEETSEDESNSEEETASEEGEQGDEEAVDSPTNEEPPTTTVGDEESEDETPTEEETPAEDTPTETPTEETPTEETPGDETATDETPANEVEEDDNAEDDHSVFCPVDFGMTRLFNIVDVNDDGEVNAEEAGTGIWMLISGADADGDGAVTLEEIGAFRPDPATRRFMRLDDNSDGVITEDEVNERIWDRISPADTNGDGVSQEELTTYRESLPSRRFRRHDDNSDGLITEDEVNPMIWEFLVGSDANEDGAISPEEFPESTRPGPQFVFGRRFRFPRFIIRGW